MPRNNDVRIILFYYFKPSYLIAVFEKFEVRLENYNRYILLVVGGRWNVGYATIALECSSYYLIKVP